MSEWKEQKLGDVINLKRGYDLPQQNRIHGMIPIFSSSGITDYHSEAMKEGPGVITGRCGTIGEVFYTDHSYWPLNTTLYVQDFKGNHPKFVFYLLKSLNFSAYSDKSAVPGLNRNDLHQEQVRVPLPEEQTAIASVLSSLDDKIDLLHRQNKTLEALASTLFRKWFVEDAGEDWEEISIGDIAEINPETISKKYPYPEIEYLDTGSITEGVISSFQPFLLSDAPSRAQRIIRENDIVYSLVRPIQRHYGILTEVKENTVASTGFCVIRSKGISPHFIYLLLTTNDAVELLNMIAEGSTSAYPSLKPSDIEGFKFHRPSEERLADFSEIAAESWRKIKSNTQQIRTLTNLRDSLLPKLMNGDIKMKAS